MKKDYFRKFKEQDFVRAYEDELKVTVDWAEMDLFAVTLKELNDDENIFAYQIDALTGIVVCENECGLAYCRSCFDYRVAPTIEEVK